MRPPIITLLAAVSLYSASPGHAVTLTLLENSPLSFPADASAFVGGFCYCTSIAGGSFGLGALLRQELDGSRTVVFSFNGANGALPHGGLVADSAGAIYGTTLAGGNSGFGTIFSYVPSSSTLTTLFHFSGYNGSDPHGGVIIDSAGTLFGSTAFGGAYNRGTLFKLTKAGVFTTLVTFDGTNGGRPDDRLRVDTLGQIYGRTVDGGPNDRGFVFKLTDVGFNGVGVDVIPEPDNWAMLIAGFGLIGAVQRRRRKAVA